MKNVDSVENLKTDELADPNENLKSWYIKMRIEIVGTQIKMILKVSAHRLVLAANSPMLGKLLAERGEGEAKLLLPDVPGKPEKGQEDAKLSLPPVPGWQGNFS